MVSPTYAGMSGKKLSLAGSTVATMAFLLFGYDQGVKHPGSGIQQYATVHTVYEVGCLLGAVVALFIVDRLGRRWMIISGAIIMILGVIIQVTAIEDKVPLVQFIIGRVVTGVGNGITHIPSPPTRLNQLPIGLTSGRVMDPKTCSGDSLLHSRSFVVVGVFIIIGMFYLPDSPRYLISKDKVEGERRLSEALSPLLRLHSQTDQNISPGATKAGYKDLLIEGRTQHFCRMVVGSDVTPSFTIFQHFVMMTPVMVVRIGWRAYPFFSAWNAILIPFIWFFYPETAGRSLEEINHIFAKGYVEKMNYVKVAKALPKLTDEGVDRKAKEYRLARHNLRYENVKQGSLSSWAALGRWEPDQQVHYRRPTTYIERESKVEPEEESST
ncbi:MFS monosaccharide transporter [Blastomyces gilchristii SLH14081]|uniref:MFS monosaccharide transporter n=1 Tax=Blastomyces gilchristii (strain SLH14081) TaxID=559298 RepID=A0A179UEW1_BLAGS|nr:MFS monosaccharide transporter [Blastomyces gilchristii SLH14081]OAT06504.1 MFS monosaccharide transporter [Blastomyces gilchristii SLH14081]